MIHCPDGVVVWLPSYSRKWRVPHDVAHAVTERELGLAQGVFGSIASVAVFDNMQVVSGRPRHDARAVSARILRSNARPDPDVSTRHRSADIRWAVGRPESVGVAGGEPASVDVDLVLDGREVVLNLSELGDHVGAVGL